jgi:hypothetical protein
MAPEQERQSGVQPPNPAVDAASIGSLILSDFRVRHGGARIGREAAPKDEQMRGLSWRDTLLLDLALFAALAGGPRRADEIARRLALDPRTTDDLLAALVTGGLLERYGELYGNVEAVERALNRLGAVAARRWTGLALGLAPALAVIIVALALLAGGARFSSRMDAALSQAPTSAGGHATVMVVGAKLDSNAQDLLLGSPARASVGPLLFLVATARQADALQWHPAWPLEEQSTVIPVPDADEAAWWSRMLPDDYWRVAVVESDPEVEQFEDQVNEANLDRTALGRSPVRVIDLRATFTAAGGS